MKAYYRLEMATEPGYGDNSQQIHQGRAITLSINSATQENNGSGVRMLRVHPFQQALSERLIYAEHLVLMDSS